MNKKLCKSGFLYALGVVAYIAIIASVMKTAEMFLSDREDNFLAPVVFLTLFVVSAAITGSLVVGKPVMLYIDGSRKEAIYQLTSTIIWLVGFLAVSVVVMILVG